MKYTAKQKRRIKKRGGATSSIKKTRSSIKTRRITNSKKKAKNVATAKRNVRKGLINNNSDYNAISNSNSESNARSSSNSNSNSSNSNPEHKITPTDNESPFEAYLAVLIDILGDASDTHNIYKEIAKPFEVLETDTKLDVSDAKKLYKKTGERVIFYYKPGESGATHYRVWGKHEKKGRTRRSTTKVVEGIIDPYEYYQKPLSHGFCQMFSYFIAAQEDDVFEKITIDDNEDELKDKYTKNTHICLQKTIKLIQMKPNVYSKMKNVFNEIKNEEEYISNNKDKKGIGSEMSFDDFIKQLKYFGVDDVEKYIHDLY